MHNNTKTRKGCVQSYTYNEWKILLPRLKYLLITTFFQDFFYHKVFNFHLYRHIIFLESYLIMSFEIFLKFAKYDRNLYSACEMCCIRCSSMFMHEAFSHSTFLVFKYYFRYIIGTICIWRCFFIINWIPRHNMLNQKYYFYAISALLFLIFNAIY